MELYNEIKSQNCQLLHYIQCFQNNYFIMHHIQYLYGDLYLYPLNYCVVYIHTRDQYTHIHSVTFITESKMQNNIMQFVEIH